MKNKALLLIFLLNFIVTAVNGKTLFISPADDLKQILINSKDGDKLVLNDGIYSGNFVIDKAINLHCKKNAKLDGQHTSDVLRVKARDVIIQNCHISNWGNNLTDMNAGIFVEKTATNISIKNNYLKGDTFGIWLDSSENAKIINNKIAGNLKIRSQDRGNGIHLFNVTNTVVKENTIWHTRDGIYIDTSNNNQLINNKIHHLRYGIHYMYSNANLVKKNHTHDTRTGYALMQSKNLKVIDNISENDSNYGILMNYIVDSTISGNQIISTHQNQLDQNKQTIKGAEGKGLFVYNSAFNIITNNLVKKNEIAIHLTAGSEDNKIYNNYFVGNRRQVKYVANRKVEWSFEKRGNFWSDYQGWDRNADGIGDIAFEPNNGIDIILWKYPAANILINSPAVETLKWVQTKFPILKSPGIKDSFPLMRNNFTRIEKD